MADGMVDSEANELREAFGFNKALATPEPASLVPLGIGTAALAWRRRR